MHTATGRPPHLICWSLSLAACAVTSLARFQRQRQASHIARRGQIVADQLILFVPEFVPDRCPQDLRGRKRPIVRLKSGAPRRARTANRRIKSPLLCH